MPQELVEVRHANVAAWHLTDGGLATLASRRGEVLVKVKAADPSARGAVFCSFSFSEIPSNSLTGSGYDPITDTAELKVCAVRIEPTSGVLAQAPGPGSIMAWSTAAPRPRASVG